MKLGKIYLLSFFFFTAICLTSCKKEKVFQEPEIDIDIRDSIIGDYIGSGYGSSWSWCDFCEFPEIDHWESNSVPIVISKDDTSDALIIECQRLWFKGFQHYPRYPFINSDSGNYLYGYYGYAVSNSEFTCEYNERQEKIILRENFDGTAGGWAFNNFIVISR